MDWKLSSVPAQGDRVAIVTGANVGLGLETARALASKGVRVIMACRNLEKAQAARSDILRKLPKARVETLHLDLSSQSSVKAFAQDFLASNRRLDLLINNAGIMMPPYELSVDGFESQLAANYLGHFGLTLLLLPLINQTAGARVVQVSSLAHQWSGIRFEDLHFANGYDRRRAYGQSKLACLMFAYELDRRLRKAGESTLSVAAHPGISHTNLFQHMPRAFQFLAPLAALVFNSARAGALPILYAALGEDIAGGDYCGPGGLRQMRGAPVKVGSNRRSREVDTAGRLWSVSEKLTGIRLRL